MPIFIHLFCAQLGYMKSLFGPVKHCALETCSVSQLHHVYLFPIMASQKSNKRLLVTITNIIAMKVATGDLCIFLTLALEEGIPRFNQELLRPRITVVLPYAAFPGQVSEMKI